MRARVGVLGADETVVKLKGEKAVVGFVMDAERGRLLGINLLVERERAGFTEWLSRYVDKLGVKAIVSDDLNTYKPVEEELGLEHQICLAHVRKNVRRRLDEIERWDWHKARIWLLLRELPDDGGRELMRMERQVREDAELRRLVVELSDKWKSLTRHKRVRGLPETNNCTERVVVRSKACPRENGDKIQDGDRLQEHRAYDEWAKADAMGMEWRGWAVRRRSGERRARHNTNLREHALSASIQNPTPFLGRLRETSPDTGKGGIFYNQAHRAPEQSFHVIPVSQVELPQLIVI